MELFIVVVCLVIGGLLNRFVKPGVATVRRVAVAYLCLAMALSTDYWIFYFAGIRPTLLFNELSLFLSWGSAIGRIVVGFLVVNILLALRDENPDYPTKKITRLTLDGITVLIGNAFLVAAAGKLQHICTMQVFFKDSGYANWFLFFIMIVEALGGLGVLLHFKLKTGPLAAAGLMLLMIGALYTHAHNKDPFSDSYAAVGQFIMLAIMQVLYYLETRNKPKPLDDTYQLRLLRQGEQQLYL